MYCNFFFIDLRWTSFDRLRTVQESPKLYLYQVVTSNPSVHTGKMILLVVVAASTPDGRRADGPGASLHRQSSAEIYRFQRIKTGCLGRRLQRIRVSSK